jgi:hypothetical protein
LKAVIDAAGSRLDGKRFGKSPATPNRTAPTISKADENQAFQYAPLARNKRTPRSPNTARSGSTNKYGAVSRFCHSRVQNQVMARKTTAMAAAGT